MLFRSPGPITKTTEQLIRAIASDESSVYMHKYEAFRAKFNPWDDGNASAKILEKMLQ